MIGNKFGRKKKAPNNEGRTTKVTSIMVSAELKKRLAEIKDAYGAFYCDTVTFNQMLERWASQVKRFDPQVIAYMEGMRKKRMQEETSIKADEEELAAWFVSREQMGYEEELDYDKLRIELRKEDEKYRSRELYHYGMAIGDDSKMQQLYDFEDAARTPEEKEKAARLLATYRRRLDAELEEKLRQEQEEKERRQAEERRREEERIAEAKAPYRMSEADREAYDQYQDEASQEDLNKRVAAALKGLPDKEQITIDGKGLWATDGELIFSVRKDGRFKKVTNWDGAVKQPETLNYKLFLQQV